MPLQPQRINVPISGGLQGDEAPEYLDPPALFICDNFYHSKKSTLKKRNGFFQVQLRTVPGIDDGGSQNAGPAWTTVPNPIVGTLGFERFLNAGDACVITGAGYLWSYKPELFAASTATTHPNATRICEIPDLAISERQIKGVVDATRGTTTTRYSKAYKIAAGAENVDGLVCSTYVVMPGSPDADTQEWHCRISSTKDASIDIDIVCSTSSTDWMNPQCVWLKDGALVSILSTTTNTLYMQWFSLKTMRWLTTNFYFAGATNVGWYDVTKHEAYDNAFAIVWMNTAGRLVLGSFYAGTWTTAGFANQYITADIGFEPLNTPGLCVATAPNGDIGVAYSRVITLPGDTDVIHVPFVLYQAYSATGTQIQAEVQVAQTGTYKSGSIAISSLNPAGTTTAKWVVSWVNQGVIKATLDPVQATAISGGNTARDAVYSRTYASSGVAKGPIKEFPSCTMASSSFYIGGSVYQILKLELPQSIGPVTQTINDCPWVLVRLYNELEQDDLRQAMNARPLSAWGYGRPIRFGLPPKIHAIDSKRSAGVLMQVIANNASANQYGEALWLETFDQNSVDRYESVPLPNNGSFFGCGSPWVFDGATAFEAAFVSRPIISGFYRAAFNPLGIGDQTSYLQRYSAGNAANAVLFKAEFIHRDASGRVTHSLMSDVYTATIPLDGETMYTYLGFDNWCQTRTIIISGLFLTARRGTVTCALYASNDGVNYAQLISVPVPGFDPNAGTPVQAVDIKIPLMNTSNYLTSSIDSAISFPLPPFSSPAPYTQDGTLQSDYPQLAAHVCRWNNRIWIANGHEVTHSHEFIDGENPAFPLDFHEYVDSEITGMSPLDDRVLAFGSDSIMFRTGEGPTPGGQNDSYSNWNFINHEVGCINSRSLVRTMVGVYFQSRRGIERLQLDGQVTHVRAVEDYFTAGSDPNNSDVVLAALSLPRDRQLRILYGDRSRNTVEILNLDYWTGTWSHWNFGYPTPLAGGWMGVNAGDLTVIGDTVYEAHPSGWLGVERPDIQYDVVETTVLTTPYYQWRNYHIPWSIVTPWIKFDGLQGFQRVWWSTLMFRLASYAPQAGLTPTFGITASVRTDYLDALETHASSAAPQLQTNRDASGVVYMRVHHKKQQCRAMQLVLSSSDQQAYLTIPTGVTEILGLFVEYGVEPGTGRLPARMKV